MARKQEVNKPAPPVSVKVELKPCPLCGGEAYDRSYGVGCRQCGLWLGDGTQAHRFVGGYKALWNHRVNAAVSD